MDMSILPKGIVTIYLSLSQTAIIQFEKPVVDFVGASSEEIFVQNKDEVMNKRLLTINPKTKKIDTNFSITTTRRKYDFWLKYDEKRAHDYIYVYPGHPNKSYKRIKETRDYIYYEGKTSSKLVNKRSYPVYVNGISVRKYRIFSKNIPLEITYKPTHMSRNILIEVKGGR